MPPESDLGSQGAGNNSSDFVRKLYRMLEDPAYRSIVRWGTDGDSFVVLDNDKFTKTILPKHFKHSNFSSFVRQLNKYDFHKVKKTEDSGPSPYGQTDVWEFKHPDFHQHKKENLDNIRRKAPAARKAPASEEPYPAAQQLAVLSETLAATQQQVQALQEQHFNMTQTNKILIDEVVLLQKTVKAQAQVHHELIAHLSTIDERRRNSRHSAQSSHSSHSGQFHSAGLGMLPDSADEPAAELRRAREILSGIPSDSLPDRELERLNTMYQNGSPPESASSSVMFNPPNSAGMPLIGDPLSDMRHLVYPVGQTAGIDPFHADHIHNIPYTRPPSQPNALAPGTAQVTPPLKDGGESLWGSRRPKILLVEDDRICAKIGVKFLHQANCMVDIASNGSDAYTKAHPGDKYDLIFMDIIMPVLDGVSATACIRVNSPRVPIVAMTSNIRGEDIHTYFQWGMNDVLAKPFTKDGMMRILKKHLRHLRKNPPPDSGDEMSQPSGMLTMPAPLSGYTGSTTMTMSSMAGSSGMPTPSGPLKFETTPIQSPATTSSWHSPGQMSHTSPTLDSAGYMSAPVNGASPMVLTPGGTQRPMGNPPMRAMHDAMQGEDRPEKRQRLYAPAQAQFPS